MSQFIQFIQQQQQPGTVKWEFSRIVQLYGVFVPSMRFMINSRVNYRYSDEIWERIRLRRIECINSKTQFLLLTTNCAISSRSSSQCTLLQNLSELLTLHRMHRLLLTANQFPRRNSYTGSTDPFQCDKVKSHTNCAQNSYFSIPRMPSKSLHDA